MWGRPTRIQGGATMLIHASGEALSPSVPDAGYDRHPCRRMVRINGSVSMSCSVPPGVTKNISFPAQGFDCCRWNTSLTASLHTMHGSG